MSKSLTPELLAHYQQSQTTITRCVRIERRDGVVIALTDHDTDVIIDGVTYQSAVGYTPTAIQTHDQGAVNTIDVEGILAVAGVSRADIAAGCFDEAKIFVFEVNYENLSHGILPLISGFWGECQLYDNHYVTEFRSLSQVLQHTVGDLYASTCRAQLGDTRCRVNVAELTLEGAVTALKNTQNEKSEFIAGGFEQPSGYFHYGLLTWKQGKNQNLSMEIKSFFIQEEEENQKPCFQLVQPMPYPIEIGDIFSVVPGCDKSLSTCKNQFNNIVNFRGEPFIPGLDHILRIP
jgi:uncharacterized phage protein (TIGR02218 family)